MLIADQVWWDNARKVGGYLAPVLFLLLGAALTIYGSWVTEDRKHRRERERRSEDWQRQTLIDLQKLMSVISSAVMHQANVWFDEVLSSQGAKTMDAVVSHDLLRPLIEMLDEASMLTSRVLDDEARWATEDFVDRAAKLLFNRRPSLNGELTDELGPAFTAANHRVGELLRTAFG